MKTISERSYVKQMLPHLLPILAKQKGITQDNMLQWKALAKKLKAELKARFQTASIEEINEDISFKRKRNPQKAANRKPAERKATGKTLFGKDSLTRHTLAMNYVANDEVVDKIARIPLSDRQWVKETRLNTLLNAISAEVELHHILTERGIKAYQKFPFMVKGRVRFANIIIPDHNIVIEMGCKELNTRVPALQSLGYRVEIFTPTALSQKRLVDDLLASICR